jgi:hypothetical protein
MDKEINKEYQEINNLEEYYMLFPPEHREKVFDQIVDIRKFEIDLYWKRASYFWAFNSVIFAGYILLLTNESKVNENILLQFQFLLICFGTICSTAWYFVNRGSKYWQVNWEKHMVAMEEKVIGSLYKTTIYQPYYQSRKKFFNLLSPYAFSVSKINHILNLFLIIIWVIFFISFLIEKNDVFIKKDCLFFYLVGLLTLLFAWMLFYYGRTGISSKSSDKEKKQENSEFLNQNIKKEDYIKFQKRGFKEPPQKDKK